MRRSIYVAGAAGLMFLLGQAEYSHSLETSPKKWAWSWAKVQEETGSTEPGQPVTVGSGLEGNDLRKLPPFDHVAVRGSVKVAIDVASGPTTADVSADDNLVSKVRTKVDGDVLTIDVEGSYRTHHPVIVRVHAPVVIAVDTAGSSDIQIDGVDGKSLKLVTSGSGDIKARGKCQSIDYVVNGSGNIVAGALDAQQGAATINGSGNIALHVRDRLVATVNGSGNIASELHPTQLTSQIRGSGDIDL